MSTTTRHSPLGAYIRRERKSRGWTQDVLAEMAGTSGPYISQIETGRVAWPGPHLRRAIANALGVSHVELLVAAGELEASEAGIDQPDADDELADVCRLLDPAIRAVSHDRALLDRWVKAARQTAELLSGLSPMPGRDSSAPTESLPIPDAARDVRQGR